MVRSVALRCSRSVALIALLVGLLTGLSATPARADISFSVSPGLLDLRATPGASGAQELLVSNTGSERVTLAVAIESVPSAPPERSAVTWLTPSVAALAIEPGQQETVEIDIDVPDRVASGGYYARVTLTTISNEAGANQAAIAGQLGVGFMLTIEGDGKIDRTARIVRVAPVLESDGRIGFRMVVVNDGNVHMIAPGGRVEVTSAGGSPFGSLEFPEATPLLPGAEVMLRAQGSLPLSLGAEYGATATFTYRDGSEEGGAITHEIDFSVEPTLLLSPTTVCENLDRGPTLTVSFENGSDLALQPQVTIALFADASGSLGAAPLGGAELLWPGEAREIAVDFPDRLVSGGYRLVTTVAFDPRGEPLVQETPFQIGGLTGTPAPLCAGPEG